MTRYELEMHSKVPMAWIFGLGPSSGLVRVPGIRLVYTELAKEEQSLVKRIGPKNFHIFRCVARYGYKDLHKKDDDFENKLFDNLFTFVRLESMMEGCSDSDAYNLYGQHTEQSRDGFLSNNTNMVSSDMDLTMSSINLIVLVRSPPYVNITLKSFGQVSSHTEVDELEILNNCRDAEVIHILGNTVVMVTSHKDPINVFEPVTPKFSLSFLSYFLELHDLLGGMIPLLTSHLKPSCMELLSTLRSIYMGFHNIHENLALLIQIYCFINGTAME
ncbi:hypothetical protein VNO77_19361 [Canavalia gladiata]|uniref:Uncharacterized protein n=1 Tax=Canavalia gladiata TaxID=3824 RepID=A0AAN9LML6_CANGL